MGRSMGDPKSMKAVKSPKSPKSPPYPTYYPRKLGARLKEALQDSPVVLIQGPRQCGKTTLAQSAVHSLGYEYISFDDESALGLATTDPTGFVDHLPERVILDEVQRVPKLFASLKLAIDRHRTAGRFILTGSVNILQIPQMTDSLAGRMEILRLHPFSQNELAQKTSGFLDILFSSGFSPKAKELKNPKKEMIRRMVAGGYPVVLQRSDERRQLAWYKNYIETLVQRDVPSIAQIRSSPAVFSQLLTLSAERTAQLLNVQSVSNSFKVSRITIESYLTLLEKMFLLEKLPAWHSSHVKRLIKTPKLHIGDTGFACALMGLNSLVLAPDNPLWGFLLETFVFQELRRQASGHKEMHTFSHYREKDGAEVDIVIERGGGTLAGVEVKGGATVRTTDFRGLRKLKAITSRASRHFAGGVLFYCGKRILSFGDGLYAVPMSFLWE